MKTSQITKEIYISRCDHNWSEHYSSNLDEIEVITAENIHKALMDEIPSHTPSLKRIEKWLNECRLNPDSTEDIFLYQDEACHECGHDPKIHYELSYHTYEIR